MRQQEYHFAYISEYEEETWGNRVVAIHLELECIRADWFKLNPDGPWPPPDQIGFVSGAFETTLVASPDTIQNINGALDLPDDDPADQDEYDHQPAHLHEGNWVEARFKPDTGQRVVIRRPSTPDIRTMLTAPAESIFGLIGFARIRPPSMLIKLRQFSIR